MSNERESHIPIKGSWVARVHTGKGNTGCRTRISVGQEEQLEHFSSFTCRLFTDYSETVVASGKRCTEKTVNEQHEAVLASFNDLYLPLIMKHYENDELFNA